MNTFTYRSEGPSHRDGHIKKGKLTGQKRPFKPKHVRAIRTRLQLAKKTRDLALFNLAIDSRLRGCDLVRLGVEDIAPHGQCNEYAVVRQRKTRRPVKFELTEQTRQAVERHLRQNGISPTGFLFPGRNDRHTHLTTRQYARLVSH